MFCLFSVQFLEKLDLEVLYFWTFLELAILDWFLTFCIKYSRIYRTYVFSMEYLLSLLSYNVSTNDTAPHVQ